MSARYIYKIPILDVYLTLLDMKQLRKYGKRLISLLYFAPFCTVMILRSG